MRRENKIIVGLVWRGGSFSDGDDMATGTTQLRGTVAKLPAMSMGLPDSFGTVSVGPSGSSFPA